MELYNAPIFRGIAKEDLQAMLPCLGHSSRSFLKGEHCLHAGQTCDKIGILTKGRLHIETSDAAGNVAILETLEAGQPFAVAYACGGDSIVDIDVIADEDSTVEYLQVKRVMHSCPKNCSCHSALVRNLLVSMSKKNVSLNRRAIAVAPKTLRGKLMAYFALQQKIAGANEFTIPFTHEELSKYLGCDRSSLSAELAKLRADGRISYKGKRYQLLVQ